MKFITLVLVLCANTLFSQGFELAPGQTMNVGINMWVDSLGQLNFGTAPVGDSLQDFTITNKEWLEVGDSLKKYYTTFLRDTTFKLGAGVLTRTGEVLADSEYPKYRVTSLRDPSSRVLDLPQPWADSTEWNASIYDPNFYFHKNHEWVYSEFDDLNQEYQKLYPYPLGGFEHQGRICKVCKTKQERTTYYGTGKNPFKKVSTNSPYSQLLLQGRQ